MEILFIGARLVSVSTGKMATVGDSAKGNREFLMNKSASVAVKFADSAALLFGFQMVGELP